MIYFIERSSLTEYNNKDAARKKNNINTFPKRGTEKRNPKYQLYPPQGVSWAISINSPVRQDWRFTSHGFLSCTPSLEHTGFVSFSHTGQMHTASSFTFSQPRLNGVLQPTVLQGSEKHKRHQSPFY